MIWQEAWGVSLEDVKKEALIEGREQGIAEARAKGFGEASPGSYALAYVEAYAEAYAERFVEGYAEGCTMVSEACAISLLKSEEMKSGELTVEKIAKITMMPVEAVNALAEKIGKE